MKHLVAFLLLVIIGVPVLAQRGDRKIYVAHVNNSDTTITKRDRDEIMFQAKSTIKNLEELLVLVTSTIPTESELDKSIKDSYLPNANQLFYNDAVVIEDDIDPRHTSSVSTTDLPVERYLKNLAMFYSKSDIETIKFSPALTTSLIEGKAYPYIKAFFTSTFSGKYVDPKNSQAEVPYQTLQRVAELRVDKVGGRWRTLIVRLGFRQPGEGLTTEVKPIIVSEKGPAKPITGNLSVYRSIDNVADSVAARWDKNWLIVVRSTTDKVPVGSYQYRKIDNTSQAFVSITLTNNDRLLSFRQSDGSRLAFGQVVKSKRLTVWLQIIAGTAALGASYVGYNSIRRDYDAYVTRMSGLNAEYAIWQGLTQQPGGAAQPTMSFGSYARPGIYAIYGGGAVGSALLLNGIRMLLRGNR